MKEIERLQSIIVKLSIVGVITIISGTIALIAVLVRWLLGG
jgi:hypothetical protein